MISFIEMFRSDKRHYVTNQKFYEYIEKRSKTQ